MAKKTRLILSWTVVAVILALIIYVGSLFSPSTATLSIFAAAGAKPPLDEICRKFGEQCRIVIETNYGGGGEVLNQMVLARSGDIYIAPEQRFMEMAQERQVIDPRTIKSIAYMVPVIAVPAGNPANITSLADIARPGVRVAVTRPETTLLGRYAPEIFAKAGLSAEIGKNVVTEAARADNLLTMLVMGQVDAGIIWHFYGVQAPDKIDIIYLPPEQLTGTGEMQIAMTTFCKDKKTAQEYIDFITSAEGKEVFKKLGYFVEAGEVERYWP
jgi:molybdate transport system substrate-binding protein